MHITFHEDNVGTLILGQLEPRRMTPRSKHYAVKYHWFREHLIPCKITLVKIATNEQLGDIFTKGLNRIAFQRLRKMLMGWEFHYCSFEREYGGTLMVLTLKETKNRYRISISSVLPIFDIRCSCQLVNSNIQVGVAARNIEFGNNLANFDLIICHI